jgi:hypothetical protein
VEILVSLSASSVLYHFTSINNATSILVGEARLTPTVIGSDQIVDSPYFLSLTRSRTGRYHRLDEEGVLFELDGKRLAQRYKIKPVDYWQMRSSPKMRHDSNEMEERLLSNDNSLDLKPFITRIEVLARPDSVSVYAIRTLKMYGRKLGVPVVFYKDKKSLQTNNRAKTVDGTDLVKPSTEKRRGWPRADRRADDIFGNVQRVLKAISDDSFDLYSNVRELGLTKRFVQYLVQYNGDLRNQLASEFQNAARSQGKDRTALDKLLASMRKLGLRTPKQLADYILARYDRDWRAARQPASADGW